MTSIIRHTDPKKDQFCFSTDEISKLMTHMTNGDNYLVWHALASAHQALTVTPEEVYGHVEDVQSAIQGKALN